MTQPHRILLASALVFAAWAFSGRLDAQEAQEAQESPTAASGAEGESGSSGSISYVLTRLGAINEGRLVDQGNAYLLEFADGGSTLVSKLDVVAIAPTRAGLFQYQMTKTHMEDVNEVLKLADWASRRKLGGEAIKALTKRLESSEDEGERRALQRKIAELQEAEAFRLDAAEWTTKRGSNAAKQSAKAAVKTLSPEDAELEEWGKKIPAPTMERFSRKAQPILQKRCARADCHGVDSESQFRLRPKALGAAARLALYYNLRSTLDYVDFDDAKQSPILNHPTVLNSKDERVYPFGEDRNSYKECQIFVEWIESLKSEQVLAAHAQATRRVKTPVKARTNAASRYEIPDPAPADASAQPQAQTAADADDQDPSFAGLFDAPGDAPQTAKAAPKLGFGVSSEAMKYMPKPEDDPNSAESQLQRVGLRPKKEYRDEYDPAIFNDRYHPKN